jgi:hypothetical protein
MKSTKLFLLLTLLMVSLPTVVKANDNDNIEFYFEVVSYNDVSPVQPYVDLKIPFINYSGINDVLYPSKLYLSTATAMSNFMGEESEDIEIASLKGVDGDGLDPGFGNDEIAFSDIKSEYVTLKPIYFEEESDIAMEVVRVFFTQKAIKLGVTSIKLIGFWDTDNNGIYDKPLSLVSELPDLRYTTAHGLPNWRYFSVSRPKVGQASITAQRPEWKQYNNYDSYSYLNDLWKKTNFYNVQTDKSVDAADVRKAIDLHDHYDYHRYYIFHSAEQLPASKTGDFGVYPVGAETAGRDSMLLSHTVSNRDEIVVYYTGGIDIDAHNFVYNEEAYNTYALRTFVDEGGHYDTKLFDYAENYEMGVGATQIKTCLYSEPEEIVIPGCYYPDMVDATPDMWTRSFKLKWYPMSESGRNGFKDGRWYIFRYAKEQGENTRKLVTSCPFDQTTYTDVVDDANFTYVYEVCFSRNAWGTPAQPIGDLTAKVEERIVREFPIDLEAESGADRVNLKWSHSRIKTGSTAFTVWHRLDPEASWEKLATVDESSKLRHTYSHVIEGVLDKEQPHYYKVDIALIDTVFTEEANAKILGGSCVKTFSASKGLYAGEVRLSWESEINSDQLVDYTIERRLLGTNDAFEKIHEMNGVGTFFSYSDKNVRAGSYYEYRVTSCFITETGEMSSRISLIDVGFSQSTGTVSGRIVYGTGQAVEGVKVRMTKNDGDSEEARTQYYAMRVSNQGAGMQLTRPADDLRRLYASPSGFTSQFWVRLDERIAESLGTSVNIMPMICEMEGGYSLFAYLKNDDTYGLRLGGNEGKIIDTGLAIEPDRYYNFAFGRNANGWTVRFVDADKKVQVFETVSSDSPAFSADSASIYFGTDANNTLENTFLGYFDEVRIWNRYLTDEELLSNYDHPLIGTEADLQMYWSLDENVPNQRTAYDYSSTNGRRNEWHGLLKNGTYTTASVVPIDYLGLYAFTNSEGNYVIKGIPFKGDGTNYVVRPTMGLHEFEDHFQTVYISGTSLVHDGVNFTDVSSFAVKGRVMYENTDYPVEGVKFFIDGVSAKRGGKEVVSDVNGNFTLSVPIGNHYISVSKDGHTFLNGGRYPADPDRVGTTLLVEDSISGLLFTDKTLVNISGRICGGTEEKARDLGLGLSKNNIGQAVVTLASTRSLNVVTRLNEAGVPVQEYNDQQRMVESATKDVNSRAFITGGKSNDATNRVVVTTDSLTGEFSIMVPPVRYRVESIVVPSNKDITFNNLPYLNPDPTIFFTAYDSLQDKQYIYNLPFVRSYQAQPVFKVSDRRYDRRKIGAFGDSLYNYVPLEGTDTIPIALYQQKDGKIDYTFGYPVYRMGELSRFEISVQEEYRNFDNPDSTIVSRVPVKGAAIQIVNEGSAAVSVGYADSNLGNRTMASDSLKTDSLGLAIYEWGVGLPNVHAPHTLGLNMTITIDGRTYDWEQNGAFKYIILGLLQTGNDFVTDGPDHVSMVLRDPPGSNSFAKIEKGSTSTKTLVWSVLGYINRRKVSGNFGSTVTHGPGNVLMLTYNLNRHLTGSDILVNDGYKNSSFHSTILTEDVATDSTRQFVGALGDLFIGQSTNFSVGDARTVDIRRNAQGAFVVNCEIEPSVSQDYKTSFTYTTYYITHHLLPELERLRNALLQTVSDPAAQKGNASDHNLYYTSLSQEDERFGSSNHDKEIWGASATDEDVVGGGPSYWVVYPDVMEKGKFYQDRVQYYNDCITNWKNILAGNEEDKKRSISRGSYYEDDDDFKSSDHNLSISGGTSITKSFTRDTVDTKGGSVHVLLSGGLEDDYGLRRGDVYRVNYFVTGIETDDSYSWTSKGHQTTSFTLRDDDPTDALTVDVLKSQSGWGPVFRTRGGRTSAPYEDEVIAEYFDGKSVLSEKTIAVEQPHLWFDKTSVVNVPGGQRAVFQAHAQNASPTGYDRYFEIGVKEGSNPNNAKIFVAGKEGGGTFLVPADHALDLQLLVEQTNPAIIEYNDLQIYLRSVVQGDPTGTYPVIEDVVPISVTFTKASTPVTIYTSSSVLNTNSDSTFVVGAKDFDRDFKGLQGVDLLYRVSESPEWHLQHGWVTDSTKVDAQHEYLPEGVSDVSVSFNITNPRLFPDGPYYFKAVTKADFGDTPVTAESEVKTVIKDLSKPKVMGYPEPADGVLGLGESIYLTFNEDIQPLTSPEMSVIVQGTRNGEDFEQKTALQMTGADETASTESSISIDKQSFAGEFWVRLQSAGIILQHGSDANGFSLSTTDNGQISLTMRNKVYTAANRVPMNEKIFIAWSYDADQTTFSALALSANRTIPLFQNEKVGAYSGFGKIIVGNKLKGTIQNLSLWNIARDIETAAEQRNWSRTTLTPNLIGHWKMDEGHGELLHDIVLGRHLRAKNANWWLDNVNYSARVDDGKYITMLSPGSLYDDESSDYAFEYWFRGEPEQPDSVATLFSTTDGSMQLMYHVDSKSLVMVSDSTVAVISQADVFEGAWHHIALNVRRTGVSAIYLDGERLIEINQHFIPSLKGKTFTLGAERIFTGYDDKNVAQYDTRFPMRGNIDEVRYWRATMDNRLVDNRYSRMDSLQSKYLGLALYLPFEEGIFDEYNQQVIRFSTDDKSGNDCRTIAATVTEDTNAPGLKEMTRQTALEYNLTQSDRQIYITLNEQLSLVEGTTAYVTVRNVTDSHGNISDPITWPVFIRQNGLRWNVSNIHLATGGKDYEWVKEASFTNHGSKTETWHLENVPDWLEMYEPEGRLDAQQTGSISFYISSSASVGEYETIIYLVGESGIYEPLLITATVSGEMPLWAYKDIERGSETMTMTGQIKQDGKLLSNTNSLLAAFRGDKCVGRTNPVYNAEFDTYFTYLTIFGEPENEGEPLKFRIWNAATGIDHPDVICSVPNVTFSVNAHHGTHSDPVQWNATESASQALALNEGWNWISFFVDPYDKKIASIFGSDRSITEVKGISSFARSSGTKWVGQLKEVKIGDMYKVNANKEKDLSVDGMIRSAGEVSVKLNHQWSWIGLTTPYTTDVKTALADANPQNGDIVKTNNSFAVYDHGEWFGDLKAIYPGRGYLYYNNAEEKTFHFGTSTTIDSSYAPRRAKAQSLFSPVPEGTYSGNMTVIAVIMRGGEIVTDGELAAFVGDECRTASTYVEDGMRFLTIPGEGSGSTIRFYFYDDTHLLLAAETLTYNDDDFIGGIEDPFVINLDNATVGISEVGILTGGVGEVFDVFGRMVLDAKSNIEELPKGVYLRNGKKLIIK